jgi:hypothetical protein
VHGSCLGLPSEPASEPESLPRDAWIGQPQLQTTSEGVRILQSMDAEQRDGSGCPEPDPSQPPTVPWKTRCKNACRKLYRGQTGEGRTKRLRVLCTKPLLLTRVYPCSMCRIAS